MIASLVLFESEFLNIVSISFTALVLNELIMVAVEVTTWHTLMILSEVFTLGLYVVSIAFLPEYFGQSFILLLPSLRYEIRRRRRSAERFDRFILRFDESVHLESLSHRRHLSGTTLDHQAAQISLRPNPIRQITRFLIPFLLIFIRCS